MQAYNEFVVGTSYTLHLPTVDLVYRNQHVNDTPFMVYPGEIVVNYTSPSDKTYVITNYGRVWSNSKKDFTKSVTGCYLPTLLKNEFTPEQLDNEYTAYNVQLLSGKYYQSHREERLAYQKKYRSEHLEQCTAAEKAYRERNKAKVNERSRIYRANKRKQVNELKDTDPDKYAEIKEAERVKRHEDYMKRKARLAEQRMQMSKNKKEDKVEAKVEEKVEEEAEEEAEEEM